MSAMKKTWAIALWICATAVLPARCQSLWKTESVSNYKLEYYDYAVNFDAAKSLCEGRLGIMIRMDNTQVSNKVYADIQSASVGYFWIGATRRDKKWRWLGEDLALDTSLITWEKSQEKQLVFGKGAKYTDRSKSYGNTGTICQIALQTIQTASVYELIVYDTMTNFEAAKALCGGIAGRLVQLDDEKIRTTVEQTLKSPTLVEHFWIGATRTNIPKNIWKWLNGTLANYLMGGAKWYSQDNYKNKENNVVIRGKTGRYGDVGSSPVYFQFGTICQRQVVFWTGNRKLRIHRYTASNTDMRVRYETARENCEKADSKLVELDMTAKSYLNDVLKDNEYYWVSKTGNGGHCPAFRKNRNEQSSCNILKPYICEQVATSVQTSNFTITETGANELICTGNGIPLPTVMWSKGTSEIADSQSDNGIYQTKSPGSSSLHLGNAKYTDEGVYNCVAYNKIAGIRHESTVTAHVKVPSKPTIISIQPHSCNSSLMITWRPHRRAVGYRHTLGVYQDHDNSIQQSLSQTPRTYENQVISFHDLSSSSLYNVFVSTGTYSAFESNYTGGIPKPVEDATLTKLNKSCVVSWNWPESTPQSLITGYKVNTTYTTAKVFGVDAAQEKKKDEETNSTRSFTIPYQPNRNHSVTIESQTCAGSGTPVTANGSCTTGFGPPESVEKPSSDTSKNAVSEDGKLNFKLKVSNESNGPISCVFVIAVTGNSSGYNEFTESDLKEANGTGNGNRYIAMAVGRQSMVGKSELNITLGNGLISTCNIRKQPKARSKRDTNDVDSYIGQNNPLSKEKSYSIYVATTTPSDDEVFFQISEPLVVEAGDGSDPRGESQDGWIIPVIVSLAAVILIVVVVIIVLFLKRRKSNKQSAPEKRSRGTENAHANGTETTTVEPRVAIPSFSSAPVAVNIEQGQALYENRKDDTTFRMPDFEEYYNRLCQENCSLFKSQFKTIKDLALADMKSTSFAAKPELKKKNRYKNILPFDSTRVVIRGSETGYINASYVDGFYRENKFIATQGPLAATENDFWLMVVENECRMIVMVAKCFEAGKKKCQKYWPDEGKSEKYGKITVQNATEIKSCGFIQRKFRVSYDNETIYVQQFQYLNWPDHGIPNTTSSLVRMHKAVMTSLKQEQTVTPVIVHCSAGAGRTGTFIGYDYLLEQSSSEDQADVLKCVLKMRSHRVDMIQNCDQYILLHKLVLEHYLFADTDLNPQEITQKLHDMERGSAQRELSKEFGDLSRLTPVKNISSKDNEDCNVVLIIPRPGEQAPPSLNASWVESYDENSPMMAAKTPDRTSFSLFWRAVSDNRVNTIITINGEREKERYWPAAVGENASFGDVRVSLLSENDSGGVVERVMQISNGSKKSTVTQYHYSEWDVKNCPKDTRYILELVESMQKNTRKENGAASVITCSDGIGRSGTYCAIVNLIERLKTENKVDVFRAVKDLRDCRPGMVKTLDQYVFCHQVISDYLKSFDIYSNFG